MKFKWMIAALFCLAGLAPVIAQTKIEFVHSSWAEALKKAEAENKLVFMDAYTDWCGPCKWMAANVFTDPAVADYFNSHFVNVKMDMEKGEGVALAKQYEVMAYPTLLMIRPNGQVHARAIGAKPAEDFLAWAKQLVDPAYVSPEDLKKKVLDGSGRNPEMMRKYLLVQLETGGQADTVFEMYRPFMQKDELFLPDNFRIFMSYPFSATSPEIQFVIENHERFAAAFPDENFGHMIAVQHAEAAVWAAMQGDMAETEKLLQRMGELPFPEAKVEIYAAKARIELIDGDFDGYAVMLDEYLTLSKVGWSELNSAGYQLASETTSKNALTYCLKWIDASIAEDRNYYNLDSKAFILYKQGKRKNAIKYMEEAIKAGKDTGDDVTESEKMLESWRGGKS